MKYKQIKIKPNELYNTLNENPKKILHTIIQIKQPKKDINISILLVKN